MTFLEHLEELRVRLIRSLVALLVGFMVCWGFADRLFGFITQPLRKAYPDIQFIYTEPTEAFMLYMKMAFFVGIFLAAFVISAVITPSGDMVTQTALALPIVGLYLIGILVAWAFGRARREPLATTAEGEVKATG